MSTEVSSRLPRLTLYGRPGCHLCEQAAEHLEQLGLPYESRSIAGDSDLEARYGHHIPVLLQGERELMRGVLSRPRLTQLKLQLVRELE